MKGVIFPICAIVAWLAAVYRGRSLLRRWDPAVFTLSLCFTLCGLTFTLAAPGVSAAVDRLTHLPNLAAFGIHISAVALSFTVLIQLETWLNPPEVARPRIRRWLIVLALVLGPMAALFFLTRPSRREEHFLLQGSEDHDGKFFVIYLLFYLAALAVGYATCSATCWRYAGLSESTWLRRGLRVTSVGLALALGYCATRASTYLGSMAGLDASRWEFLVPVFAGGAALLSVIGMLIPAWGPHFDAALAWRQRYVSFLELEPLWRAYYSVMPDIALDPPRRGRRFAPGDLNHRLLRRMIEIWDGRLAIAPDIDPAVADQARLAGQARGLGGEALEAAVEAAQIKIGLLAWARRTGGERFGPQAEMPMRPEPRASGETRSRRAYVVPAGRAELELERQWMVLVARAFACSPVIDDLRRESVARDQ